MRTEELEKREKQIKPMTWHSVNRHKFFDETRLARIQAQYTVADLRKIIKGWSWNDVINGTLSGRHVEGVHFHGRIGVFLCRSAIAVCAVNKIVVLRYVTIRTGSFTDGAVITGEQGCGFALLQSDFQNRIYEGPKITDPVIGADDEG
jgi:hypothetical protein